MKKVKRTRISAGKDPMGIIAAVLFLACIMTGEAKTQKEIAQAAGVTEVTVRNRHRDLNAIMQFSANS